MTISDTQFTTLVTAVCTLISTIVLAALSNRNQTAVSKVEEKVDTAAAKRDNIGKDIDAIKIEVDGKNSASIDKLKEQQMKLTEMSSLIATLQERLRPVISSTAPLLSEAHIDQIVSAVARRTEEKKTIIPVLAVPATLSGPGGTAVAVETNLEHRQ